MISRIVNDDKDCKPPKDDKSLFIKGDARFETDGKNVYGVHIEGDTRINTDGRTDNALYVSGGNRMHSSLMVMYMSLVQLIVCRRED